MNQNKPLRDLSEPVKSGIFSKTVVEETEDLILTPYGTTGTNTQIGGTQDLWSSLIIFQELSWDDPKT